MSGTVVPVVECADVALAPGNWAGTAMHNVSLSMEPGELLLVAVSAAHPVLPLCDALSGLGQTLRGKIFYRSTSWEAADAGAADKMRLRIGRVFERWGFISHLNLEENLLLQGSQRQGESFSKLHKELLAYLRSTSLACLEPILKLRPHDVSPMLLQKAAWARALYVHHDLLLLERPTEQPVKSPPEEFRELVLKRLSEGAAALWTTRDDSVLNFKYPCRVHHVSVNEGRIAPAAKVPHNEQ